MVCWKRCIHSLLSSSTELLATPLPTLQINLLKNSPQNTSIYNCQHLKKIKEKILKVSYLTIFIFLTFALPCPHFLQRRVVLPSDHQHFCFSLFQRVQKTGSFKVLLEIRPSQDIYPQKFCNDAKSFFRAFIGKIQHSIMQGKKKGKSYVAACVCFWTSQMVFCITTSPGQADQPLTKHPDTLVFVSRHNYAPLQAS